MKKVYSLGLFPTVFFLGVLADFCLPVLSAPFDVIICGSGGTEEFQQKFSGWGNRLKQVLTDSMNHPQDHVLMMQETVDSASSTCYETNLETIHSVFNEVKERIHPEDDLYIYLIGHGSYLRQESKFNIPGPDLTAAELGSMIDAITARRVIVINASSASAGFINQLSKETRILCTAAKSVEEINATEFMEYFLQSLEEGSADRNRDERISMLEVCQQAASLTASWYMGGGLIATEHSLLDDNGDGFGTRLPIVETGAATEDEKEKTEKSEIDGTLASRCYIKDYIFPDSVPNDLVDRYISLLEAIEQLKSQKSGLDEIQYYIELEVLLVEAAKANLEIHSIYR